MVYEVLVVVKPTKKEEEEGKLEKVIYGPDIQVAANEQAAAMQVCSENPDVAAADKGRLDITVRPFA